MSPEQFLQVADLLPDAALLVTGDGTVLAASRRVADRLGLAPDRLGGRPLADRAAGPPGGLADYLRACARSREPVPGTIVLRADDGREVACRAEGAALRPAGEAGPALLLLRLFPRDASVSRYLLLNQKIDELAREVRRRRHAEGLLTGQKRVLEGIARGEPLPDILDALARLVEGEYPGSLCSVLLLDGGRLRHGAAPNLPADYTRALDGLPIGPCAGSCGTAAYRGEPVVVADLAADPLWDGYRDLALRHGLRACWSVPVFSSVGRVLGTLAVYYRQPRRPAPGEAAFAAEVAAYLAGIAVERARTEEALRQRAEQLAEANRHKEELLASLRASEEQFRTLADSIPQLAWMARPDGYLFWYNRRWYEYTGTTPEQMAGWGWQSVHDPAELPRVLARWKAALASGEPWEDTFPLRRRDGELRWHLSRALPVRDDQGRVTRWFGTNTDITERMRMEAALREADRRKDLFLATLAHELRNPLAPIRNAVQILRLPGTDAAARAQALEMMERQLRHLVRLLDDLMDVSRIMRGKVKLQTERTELAAAVARAVEAAQPLLEARGHELTVTLPPEPVWLEADPVRLAQVVSNLLNNAARYTEPGGRVWLTAAREGGEVVLRVRDTGAGIAPGLLPHIFELFVQAEQALHRAQGGLGIGLTLVKGLVEMHGGRVTAHSDGPGKGSEFVVRLPAPAEARAAPGPAAGAAPPAGVPPRRVLVVDDGVDTAESLAMLLRLHGQEVRVAHDGPAAVAAARAFHPEVVLLDIGLPGLSGYEVARRLRAEEGPVRPLVVAMTGWGQEEDRRRSQEAGFDLHLTKPVDPAEVLRLLARAGR